MFGLLVLQAGMISDVNSQNLIIALEPEAASLYCRNLGLNHFVGAEKTDTKMPDGTKHLVLDCGGMELLQLYSHNLKYFFYLLPF